MSFRHPEHPREMRSSMQVAFDRYASGESKFPLFRVNVPVESLPRKSQHAARLLVEAWERIDQDREVFNALVEEQIAKPLKAGEATNQLIAGRIGKNAVEVVLASGMDSGESKVVHMDLTIEEYRELMDKTGVKMSGGEVLEFEDGVPTGPSAGAVVHLETGRRYDVHLPQAA